MNDRACSPKGPAWRGTRTFGELLAAWRARAEAEDLAPSRRLLVLLDAVNESDDPKRLLEQAAALAADAAHASARAGRPWVKVVVTVRSVRLAVLFDRVAGLGGIGALPHARCFAHFPSESGDRLQAFLRLPVFSETESAQAYAGYVERYAAASTQTTAGWTDLPKATRTLLRLPLPRPGYSARSATTGLTLPARRAGHQLAATPTSPTSTMAPA